MNLTLADGASYVMDHQRYESYITIRMLEKYSVVLYKKYFCDASIVMPPNLNFSVR